MADYIYIISTSFPSGHVIPGQLHDEISASAITAAQDSITTTSETCIISFKIDLSAEEVVLLDGLVAVHNGIQIIEPSPPTSLSGIPLVMSEPREGSSIVVVTHNWADRCTWYNQSVRVEAEELTTSDDMTFSSAHSYWIDLSHGRLYAEDRVSAPYLPQVFVDNELATERIPWAVSGGDYCIDYISGAVVFFEAQTGTVTSDYSYENGSLFIVTPSAGKRLVVENSEVQFSSDLIMLDTINFQPWAYNPADLPNKVPVEPATVYKTIRDFVDEARGVYPIVPAIGGIERGLTNTHVVFPYNYKTVKELQSSYGVEIRIWLSSDQSYSGEFGTATFYCTSKDEDE